MTKKILRTLPLALVLVCAQAQTAASGLDDQTPSLDRVRLGDLATAGPTRKGPRVLLLAGGNTQSPPTANTGDNSGSGNSGSPTAAPGSGTGGASGTGTETGSATATDSVDARVRAFVEFDWLNGTPLSVSGLLADRLDRYYGQHDVPRASVVRDKRRYFSKWPNREYRLLPETLRTTERDSRLHVSFEYTYALSNGRRSLAGRGLANLVLIPNGDRFLVASEYGEVLEKY